MQPNLEQRARGLRDGRRMVYRREKTRLTQDCPFRLREGLRWQHLGEVWGEPPKVRDSLRELGRRSALDRGVEGDLRRLRDSYGLGRRAGRRRAL